ncbi:Hypp8767 [Branchiostoma lanceolatum]|uniref:Hypp8767 protein n=1 Tax=Branchiostoma lanceolatum TaxID=7740 RepID=A0A8J9ZAI9_BRALA|nr:Hypp8767 [Branchiostoma lanceolatum]
MCRENARVLLRLSVSNRQREHRDTGRQRERRDNRQRGSASVATTGSASVATTAAARASRQQRQREHRDNRQREHRDNRQRDNRQCSATTSLLRDKSKEWTQSLVIPMPKKGNLRQCQNYRTISLISHPSKILLRVILKRLKTKAEELLAEKQAGFRPGRSTTEQIFNCRLIIEKHLQHQRDLFHNFIDFKKAFDRVWHDGLWWVLRGFGVEEGLIQTIEALYEKASSAVFLNNRVGEFFRTTVGVHQGCLISPVLFNLYLEKIIQDTLQDHHTSISIGGRRICNLRFADDIDLLAGTNTELQDLTDKLTQSTGSFGMEVSTEKSKVMVYSKDETQAVIFMNGQQLEGVDSFTYKGTSRTEHKLYKALVVSVLLYGCETWTLLAETERKIQAFEMKCMRRLVHITYHEHKTNEYVRQVVRNIVGPKEPLLATVKRRKLQWFGHVTRHDNLAKTHTAGHPGRRSP